MIKMTEATFEIAKCESDLKAFEVLLQNPKEELGETILLKFFREHPNLILLMGKIVLSPRFYMDEFNLFNEFYPDFGIADKSKESFVFVEFEEAKQFSIFGENVNKSSIRHEWGIKLERGFSQIINWFYRLEDYKRTNKYKEHFEGKEIKYWGILVVGRDEFIPPGSSERIEWRFDRVRVDLKQVHFYTYDGLYRELKNKFDILVEERNLQ
jgi:hypothetical protein